MEPTQGQTIQADVRQLLEQMHEIAGYENRLQLAEPEAISGYSCMLMDMAELYRRFCDAVAGYRRFLGEDMRQAQELLAELEEADERILY